ncbi:MAG: hypothetical protein CMQ40_02340 [Gammaproteobacteria bacterium]|nr:hypothetical protein [Gammaproteobacteria bacterium]
MRALIYLLPVIFFPGCVSVDAGVANFRENDTGFVACRFARESMSTGLLEGDYGWGEGSVESRRTESGLNTCREKNDSSK